LADDLEFTKKLKRYQNLKIFSLRKKTQNAHSIFSSNQIYTSFVVGGEKCFKNFANRN